MNRKEAITTELSQQLVSTKASQRKAALQVLKGYDYASVEDILLSALSVEKDKNILNEFFEIFYANSSEELFYKLYFQAKSVDDSQTQNEAKFQGIEDLLSRMATLLSETKYPRRNSLYYYKEAETRWNEKINGNIKREEHRQESIQKFIKKTNVKEANKERKELMKFAFMSHAAGFLIVLIVWFCLRPANIQAGKNDPSQQNGELAQQMGNEEAPVFLPETAISIKGVVVDSSEEYRQVMLQCENEKYMLAFPEDTKIPASGEELSCQVYVEDYTDGVYVAQVVTIY